MASGQGEDWKVGATDVESFVQQAAVQLDRDRARDVLQVHSAGDTCSSQPQAMGIRIGDQASSDDVTHDVRADSPRRTPRAHRRLVDGLVTSQVEQLTAFDMLNQCLFH